MLPYYNPQEYNIFCYKKQLKKDANNVGIVSLLFFIVMFAASFVAVLIPTIAIMFNEGFDASSSSLDMLEGTAFLMLLNGLVSLIAFFGVSIIYSIIVKADLGKMFPLNKVGTKDTYLLCSFGLAVAMIANYVSNIIIALFDAFGINAYVDINYECDSFIDVILFYISVAVLPALVEEFAFRGVILTTLRKHSDGLAVLVSGILFGLMHGNFTQIPFALVVGFVLGYITVKTNSLLPAIIIHFLNNSLSVTFTLLYSNTSIPEYIVDILNIVVTFIVCILGIISFIVLSTKHRGFFKLKGADDVIPFKEKIKTVCKSPTIITFTVISLLEAILMLFMET